jgi:large subunit ribosomal protein L33
MADTRVKITLRCNECKQRNYNTNKNKKNTPENWNEQVLPFLPKATAHTETK